MVHLSHARVLKLAYIYIHIMSVIDIFSVDFFSSVLFKQKRPVKWQSIFLDTYMEHGPQEILQSNLCPEFKGVVRTVGAALNVRIVKSSAYSPQTQGKDGRSHRTWNEGEIKV